MTNFPTWEQGVRFSHPPLEPFLDPPLLMPVNFVRSEIHENTQGKLDGKFWVVVREIEVRGTENTVNVSQFEHSNTTLLCDVP